MLRRLLPRSRTPFETRTELWKQAGLGAEIDRQQAQRARGGALIALLLLVGVLILFDARKELFPGHGTEVRVATVIALMIVGYLFARSLGRGLGPPLYRRLDPGVAGTIGFLVRLVSMVVVLVVALRIAGLKPGTLAVGGAFTAILLGLAAQQTLGNLFAGMVLLGTRPFRVGERVRLQGGWLAGQLEGVVGSLGLFYTTLASGADRIMIPNGVLVQCAVTPLREPQGVELRARFGAETTPREVQEMLEREISVPLRYPPHIAVEEFDRDKVVVRIVSTPSDPTDGARLAEEVLAGVRGAEGGDGAA